MGMNMKRNGTGMGTGGNGSENAIIRSFNDV